MHVAMPSVSLLMATSTGIMNFEQFLHAVQSLGKLLQMLCFSEGAFDEKLSIVPVFKGGRIASSLVRSRMDAGDSRAQNDALGQNQSAAQPSKECNNKEESGGHEYEETTAEEAASSLAAEHAIESTSALPQDGGAVGVVCPKGPASGRQRVGARPERAVIRPRPRSAMGYLEAEKRMELSAWFPENDVDELCAIAREEAQMMIRRAEKQAQDIQKRRELHDEDQGGKGALVKQAAAQKTSMNKANSIIRLQDKKAKMEVWEAAMERVYPTSDGAPAAGRRNRQEGNAREGTAETEKGRGDGKRQQGCTGRPLSENVKETSPSEDVGYILDARGEHHLARTEDGTVPLVRRGHSGIRASHLAVFTCVRALSPRAGPLLTWVGH